MERETLSDGSVFCYDDRGHVSSYIMNKGSISKGIE